MLSDLLASTRTSLRSLLGAVPTAALCGILLLAVPMLAQGQNPGVIEGQVIDAETGTPLSSANISVVGTQRGTTTNAEGNYRLTVSAGTVRLRVSFVGYGAAEETVQVEAGETYTIDFELSPGSTLDDVVVVGSRAPSRSALQSAVPVDALPVDELTTQSPQTDLTQLLTYAAPSFQANRQSSSDATEFIDPATLRSLPPDQLLVLVNGKRRHKSSLVNTLGTVGRGAVGTDLNAIPSAAVEQIEVLRNGASAQYGSDAVAGVLNLQMKEATNQLTADVTTGIHNAGDGEVVKVSANYGFGVGEDGFVNVTGMFQDRARTNRADGNELILFDQSDFPDGVAPPSGFPFAYPQVAAFIGEEAAQNARRIDNEILDRRGLERSDFRFRVGQSAIQQRAVFLNSEFGLRDDATLYAFGGLSYKNGIGAPFRRLPFSVSAMPYQADNDSPSLFPNGFQPEMNSDVVDQSLTVGVRGTIGGWSWDLSNSYGRNSLDYQMDNTVNASLLQASPTSIYAGRHAFTQDVTNLDVSRFFGEALAGVNVAFGGAYRVDRYQIFAGEEASYRDYGRAQVIENGTLVSRDTLSKDPGTQGFVGFRPENEVDRTRSNAAAYLDTEVNVTDAFLVTAAGRYEHYSDFGGTLNGRLAARLGLLDERLNLRGSASTGFRAPSLHQIYFNEVRTDFDDEGQLVNIGTFSNDSEVARVLGIPRLEEERSRSYSAGLTASPLENLDLTIDGYQINVDDRVVLTGEFSSGLSDLLAEVGAQNAQVFANAVDTRTTGLDVVATYRLQLPAGTAELSAAGNLNDTEIESLTIPETVRENYEGDDLQGTFFGRQEQGFLTESNPESKVTLSADYQLGGLGLLVRTVRFGEQVRPGFAQNQVHSPEWVVDASVSYDLTENVALSVAANNLFNNYPDEQVFANSYAGVFDYAPVQQGFNGAFYVARLNVRL